MINDFSNHWIPGEGYRYLSNGETYTDGLYLGRTDSIDNWHDTNDKPPAPEDEPTTEDKAEAYDILMGVSE